MKFEQRVPVPSHSVSARCGEGEVTVEVQQNFLGNGCLNWSVVGGFSLLGNRWRRLLWPFHVPSAPFSWCLKNKGFRLETRIGKLNGTVKMGHSVLITANGTDYGLADQYYVSSYFFTLRRAIRSAQTLSLQWRIKNPFYLSCGWTCTCRECYWLDQEKKWPQVMVLIQAVLFFFSLFVLRKRSVDPSKWCDLRRLRRPRHRWPHPEVPDRATWLRQHNDGVWLSCTVCPLLCIWSHCNIFILSLDDRKGPRLHLFSDVLSNTHRQHLHF